MLTYQPSPFVSERGCTRLSKCCLDWSLYLRRLHKVLAIRSMGKVMVKVSLHLVAPTHSRVWTIVVDAMQLSSVMNQCAPRTRAWPADPLICLADCTTSLIMGGFFF
jgi:hypothetical protein